MADRNYISYADEIDVAVEHVGIVPPEGYDDTLKFSNCWRVKVRNCVIFGGGGDCIDAVRGGDLYFSEIDLFDLGKNGMTIKGGVDGYRIENVKFYGRGKYSEIELGQFDKYQRYPFKRRTTGGVIADVKMMGGHPEEKVRIFVWNADVPKLRGCEKDVDLIVIPKWVWFPYFCFRRFCIKVMGAQ